MIKRSKSSFNSLLHNVPKWSHTYTQIYIYIYIIHILYIYLLLKQQYLKLYLEINLWRTTSRKIPSCFYSPIQVLPSPLNPSLHAHRKLPSIFVQLAFGSQLLVPSVHSLLSVHRLSLTNVYPFSHKHWKEPTVFAQIWKQGFFASHSLMSKIKKRHIIYCIQYTAGRYLEPCPKEVARRSKKGVLKNFTKFTRKHLCLFFNKVAGWGQKLPLSCLVGL